VFKLEEVAALVEATVILASVALLFLSVDVAAAVSGFFFLDIKIYLR